VSLTETLLILFCIGSMLGILLALRRIMIPRDNIAELARRDRERKKDVGDDSTRRVR